MINPALIEMYAREQQRDLAIAAAAEAQAANMNGAQPRRGLAGLLAALRGQRPAPQSRLKPLPQPLPRVAAPR